MFCYHKIMRSIIKVLIINPDNQILVLRRSLSHPFYPHHLDFPGGEKEANETELEALKREIIEETGLDYDLTNTKLLISQLRSKDTNVILYSLLIKEANPKLTLSWEHDDYLWLSQQQLIAKTVPEPIDGFYEMTIEYLENNSI